MVTIITTPEKNIINSDELYPEQTVAKNATVQKEGNSMAKRNILVNSLSLQEAKDKWVKNVIFYSLE